MPPLPQASPTQRRTRPSIGAQIFWVLHKDVLLEWRSRARLNATIFFAVSTLLLFSFAAGPQPALLNRLAAGFLWLAVFFASVLSLGESMRFEGENAAIDGLRLLPVSPLAIFLGKALVNTLFLFALALVTAPLALALYGAEIKQGVPSLLVVLLLGTAAVSAPGTLYAAIALHARAREVVLPLLLFPILVPGLLAAVRATTLVLSGDVMGELGGWTMLLLAFNVIYWPVCGLLFARVLDE